MKKDNIILIGMPSCGKTTIGTELSKKIGYGYINSDSVIVARGSVIYRDYAMQKLRELGTLVYLELTYETVEERLGDLKQRGVAIKEGFTLRDLYEERKVLYEKYADIAVKLDGKTIAESVEAVAKAIEK